ncbi:MAG: glycosyltransferase family 4 protein [Dehalococcoidia bacterium]|nr:glycosyltransferase family 4 protein [Dehalococcoidia bacterium]
MDHLAAEREGQVTEGIAPGVSERPLKIGLASAYDFASRGGVQTHIRELGQQLRTWGHDVRIVAPCSDTSKVDDEGFIPMGKPFPLPSRGSVGRISVSVWLRGKIKEMLDEQQFDVIHMHEPFSSYVCVGMLSQSEAVNIATFHAYPGSRVYDVGGARIAQPYFEKLHGRIAVSQPAKEYISSHFDSDYEIIPNGVRIDQYQQGVEPFPHLQDGMINLLFLGRADKRKGLKYLLLAYSKLKWDWPNLRLIVMGPGNPNGECQRIMGERSLQDVMFVGGVSDEDKFRYLKTADVYCSPATGGESFGMVLVEAMAAGLPVVASEIPGYMTVVRNGIEAMTFPPKDVGALVDALGKVLEDADLKRRLAGNALRRAEEFRWERVARRVLDYYVSCMNGVGRSREVPVSSAS